MIAQRIPPIPREAMQIIALIFSLFVASQVWPQSSEKQESPFDSLRPDNSSDRSATTEGETTEIPRSENASQPAKPSEPPIAAPPEQPSGDITVQPAEKPRPPPALSDLPFQYGEFGNIAGKAKIKLGPDDAFLAEEGTKKLLVKMGNPPSDGGFALLPTNNEQWVALFHFEEEGYVKDDDKLDADKLFEELKDLQKDANKERKKLGVSELFLLGWEIPPHYDATTKRLEWGLRLQDDQSHITVNYSTRLLGRTGFVRAVLICKPEVLEQSRRSFAQRLAGFEFVEGEKYAEFREGDKIAKYGLAGLITGTAVVAATKYGSWLWKVLVGLAVAIGAAFKAIGRKKS